MKKLGRVMEVYLPFGEELTKIGFKIQIENEIIDIIEKQNMDNPKIFRDDIVYVETTNNADQIIYNIELINNYELEEDNYE